MAIYPPGVAALLPAIATLPRRDIEAVIEALIELVDPLDGDPDREDDDPAEDCDPAEQGEPWDGSPRRPTDKIRVPFGVRSPSGRVVTSPRMPDHAGTSHPSRGAHGSS